MTSKIPPGISLYEIMLNKLPYTVEDVDGRPAFPSLAPPLREFTALLMRTLAELRIEYPPIPAQATSQPSSVTVITDQAPAKFAQDVAREVSRATAGLSPAAACLETTITAELPDGRTASVSTLSRAEEPVISPSADQPGVYTILGAKNDVTDAKIASQPPLTFEPSEAEVVARIAAPEDALSEFKEGQWWVKELDHMAGHNPGGDLARAVAVVHNLLRASLDYQSEREDAENVIRQQAEHIRSLTSEIDLLRVPVSDEQDHLNSIVRIACQVPGSSGDRTAQLYDELRATLANAPAGQAQLRAPAAGHQPYPEMPPADLEHNSYSRAAVKAAMKEAHDRGYSVGWDHGHEHAVTASAPVAGWSLRGPSAGNWRDEFSRRVYEDLAAADNQDVPLEEYPARILGVLDALASAPVADESPMAKMAEALREKARQEQQAYQDRRNQATEWGPMPHGTEADLPASAPVAGEAQPVIHQHGFASDNQKLRAINESLDEQLEEVMAERDDYHDWADELSEAIAAHLGVEIGEHSSSNLPWLRALDAIKNAAPQASEAVRMEDLKAIAREVAADSAAIRAEARNAALEEAAKLMDQTSRSSGAALIRAQASAPVAGEAQPVGYLQAASEVGSVGMLKRFITADDFGGDDAALSAWAKSSGAAPLYATPQASPAAGHAFRALLDRSKVPGKDYLYCIKPSEIDAAIGEASAPTVAESLNRCEQSTPTLMESNNGAARILADITLTGTTPAERFDEERKHFAWNKP